MRFGDIHVLCTATLEQSVPPFLRGGGQTGRAHPGNSAPHWLRALPDGMTAPAIIEAIHADVKAHARGAEPSDDITLLALVWRGSSLMGGGGVAVSTPLDE